MDAWWVTHASRISQVLLVVGFIGAAVWETARPRHALALSTSRRWLLHGAFYALAAAASAVVFGVSAVVLANSVRNSAYGLLNRPSIPFAIRAVAGFAVLDLAMYASHYLRHAVPILWRFHRVHHADGDFDFSTGLRFHPGEVLFTQGTYLLAIAALAPPPSLVACFEAVSILQAFFSHANVVLPRPIEERLRLIQVTPQMHEIHHSRTGSDQRTNYGVIFSCWDRLFGTYRASAVPSAGRLRLGLEDVPPELSVRPWAMLRLPF